MNRSTETAERLLPKGFEDLAPYLDWALPDQHRRGLKRMAATLGECRAFYDAITPRIEDLIHHLEHFPRSDVLDPANNRLFMLGLAYMDAALPIELGWKSTVNEGSFPADRINNIERP